MNSGIRKFENFVETHLTVGNFPSIFGTSFETVNFDFRTLINCLEFDWTVFQSHFRDFE